MAGIEIFTAVDNSKNAFQHKHAVGFVDCIRSNAKNCVSLKGMLHRRVCKDNATCKGPKQSSEHPPHRKIDVTSKPPVGGISVVTLIRTDTTLDHSQKAEKVCRSARGSFSRLSLLISKFALAFEFESTELALSAQALRSGLHRQLG